MMDIQTIFSTAQTITGNGVTVSSTDWIPTAALQNFGDGNEPCVEFRVTTTFAGGTSMTIQLVAVDTAGANPVVLDQSPTLLTAALPAGTIVQLKLSPKAALPAATLTCLRLQYVLVGNMTAGAGDAYLAAEIGSQRPAKAYPSGW